MPPPSPPVGQPLTPLSMAILLALAGEELHGYALLREIERQTGGELSPGTGSLYAALQRLMDDGLIGESATLPGPDEDRRRRYYRITDAGREVARAESRRMLRVLEVARARDLAPT
jgi:DNA-binding PadR family transcriptional regulator